MEDNEEIENENSKDIIIVNEDGFKNCLIGFNYDEKPREVFQPIINSYKYQYYITKDSDPKNDDKFKEKVEKSLLQFELQEQLKSLNINLQKEYNNNEDIINIEKIRSNYYPFDEYGIIQNWDDMEFIWREIFSKKLRVSPEECNIILTEGINNTKKNRQKMGEIMFETFHIPKLFISKKLTLPLYSQYSKSGLMIDFGNDIITIAPIFEGYCLLPIETFEIPSYSPFFQPNIIDKMLNIFRRYDFDIQKELTRCIYLYGTPSRIERISEQISHKYYYMYGSSKKNPGISEQFTKIIQGYIPSCYEYVNVKVLKENTFPYWEGALQLSNILSKSDWISKNEYEEKGSDIINRKCF